MCTVNNLLFYQSRLFWGGQDSRKAPSKNGSLFIFHTCLSHEGKAIFPCEYLILAVSEII